MLRILGLSPVEQGLYELLVARPPVTHAEARGIAVEHGWQDQAEAALDRLLELSLVTALSTDPPRYATMPPHVALDALVGACSRELAVARQRMLDLSARFHRKAAGHGDDPLIEVIHGRAAMNRWIADMHAGIRHSVDSFEKPPYVGDTTRGNVLRTDDDRPHVLYRMIYDPTAMNLPGRLEGVISRDRPDSEQMRVADVPLKMFLIDHRVAFLPYDARAPLDSMLVVRDPTLLAVLHALFESYWEHAVPLEFHKGRPGSAGDTGLPDSYRDLLPLLASGYTDKAIATQLGRAERTVNRWVSAMIRDLGADTRFQAGYQAVAHGWIGLTDARRAAGSP